MRLRSRWAVSAAFLLSALAPACAIEITLASPELIVVSGAIRIGDGKLFRTWIERQYKPHIDAGDTLGASWKVALNSPGGSLADGIEIGRILHEFALVSLIRKSDVCYSACAIAYLGGVFQYVTGVGPQRHMEVGGTLGFHGYRSEETKVLIANEAFDQTRALNGVVLEYAAEMRQIDLGYMAELMNVPPSELRLINTPSSLQKLAITIDPPLPRRPKNAGYNACATTVRKLVPAMDGYALDERLASKPTMIANARGFLNQMISDLYWEHTDADAIRLREQLAKLPLKEAIDLLTGRQVYLDNIVWPIERYPMSRGSGFYFDQCYALFEPTGDQAQTIAVAAQAPWIYTHHGLLDFFAPDERLWR